MVARRGSPGDAGSSMNGQRSHPRATMKLRIHLAALAPTGYRAWQAASLVV